MSLIKRKNIKKTLTFLLACIFCMQTITPAFAKVIVETIVKEVSKKDLNEIVTYDSLVIDIFTSPRTSETTTKSGLDRPYDHTVLTGDEALKYKAEHSTKSAVQGRSLRRGISLSTYSITANVGDKIIIYDDAPHAAFETDTHGTAWYFDKVPRGRFNGRNMFTNKESVGHKYQIEVLEPGIYTYYVEIESFSGVFERSPICNITVLDPNARTDIPRTPRLNGSPFRYPGKYVDGRLVWCALDPVDVITGDFIWNYTDLKILGKHNLEYKRIFNKDACVGNIGKGWSDNFSYTLKADKKYAYFILPHGEGVPFTYDAVNDVYVTDSPKQQRYKLSRGADESYIISCLDGTEYLFDKGMKIKYVKESGIKKHSFNYDSDGNMKFVENIYGEAICFDYDDGKISKAYDKYGHSVIFRYDDKNRLIKSVNSDGDSLIFTYDDNGYMTSITDFMGRVYLENTYENGKVIAQNIVERGLSKMIYAEGMTTYEDELGNKTKYYINGDLQVYNVEYPSESLVSTYNGSNQVLTQTDALSRTTRFGYDDKGRQNSITYADGTNQTMVYNNNNYPEKITNQDGTSIEYTYDNRNNMVSSKDQKGNMENFTYDGDDNLTSHIDKKGNTSYYTYDNNGFLQTATDPTGGVTNYKYDAIGRLLDVRSPLGKTMTYNYSPVGKLLSTTDPSGTMTYTPDANGKNTSITDKRGNRKYFTYDVMNNVKSETDFMGNGTGYEYDQRGKLVKTVDPLGYYVQNSYDDKGNVVKTVDKNRNETTYSYDAVGQLTTVTSTLGNSMGYTYDNMGRVSVEKDARDRDTVYTYDDMGRIKTERDSLGGIESYNYDENGNLVDKTDKNGGVTRYEYDKNDRVVKIVSPDGGRTEFVYDGVGRIVSASDYYGNVETTVYNQDGSPVVAKSKENAETKYEYDNVGRIGKIVFPDGSFASNEYDANGNLLEKADSEGNTYKYEYDKNNQLVKTTDPESNVTAMEYTARGEISAVTTAVGGTVKFKYDGNGNVMKEINPLAGITEYGYDGENRLVERRDPLGAVNKYSYDGNGNMLTVTDPLGNVTEYTYDALNRNTKIGYPDGSEYLMEYDGLGNLVYVKDGEGAETKYEYDPLGRLVKLEDALGNGVTRSYDKLGRVISTTDQNGAVNRTEYSPDGNVVKVIDGNGGVVEYSYDVMDRVTSITDPKGGVSRYEYNLLGQVVKEIDPIGNAVGFSYDGLNRIKTVTDPKGGTVSYEYDGNGNVVSTTDQNGVITRYEYDVMNNMTKMVLDRTVSGRGSEQEVTIYKYNKRGEPIEEVNPAELVKSYVYDGNGNLVVVKDEEGKETKNSYGENGNLEKTSFPDGKEAVYHYNKNGELVKLEDWNGETTFQLDPLGRLKEVTDHNNKTTKYEYDGVGNKTAMVYPNGSKVEYAYDAESQLVKVKDGDGETTTYSYDVNGNEVAQVNPNGEKTEYTYNELNLKTTAKEILNDEIQRVNEYSYDELGNVVREVQKDNRYSALDKTKVYEYDALNQLVKDVEVTAADVHGNAKAATRENVYSYDSVGNMVKEVNNGKATEYTYNNLNQQLGKVTPNASYEYKYDVRGNLVTESRNREVIKAYEYDGTNRMVVGVNKETDEESKYAFNALGKRIQREQKIGNNNVGYQNNNNYATEEYADVLAEIASGGSEAARVRQKTFRDYLGLTKQASVADVKTDYVTDYTSGVNNDIVAYEKGSYVTEYVYGNGNDRISQKVSHEVGLTDILRGKNPNTDVAVEGIGKAYFHENRLGSTAFVTDRNGEMLGYTEYDVWGKILDKQDGLGSLGENGKQRKIGKEMNVAGVDDIGDFTGHTYDEVLEKHFAQARFYDPVGKRFLTDDVVKDGLNWYSYCYNNPVNMVDLTGLAPSWMNAVFNKFNFSKSPDVNLQSIGIGGSYSKSISNGIRSISIFSSIFGGNNYDRPNFKSTYISTSNLSSKISNFMNTSYTSDSYSSSYENISQNTHFESPVNCVNGAINGEGMTLGMSTGITQKVLSNPKVQEVIYNFSDDIMNAFTIAYGHVLSNGGIKFLPPLKKTYESDSYFLSRFEVKGYVSTVITAEKKAQINYLTADEILSIYRLGQQKKMIEGSIATVVMLVDVERAESKGEGSGETMPTPDTHPGDFDKLKGDQGWKDSKGNIWKKDKLHKDHWDVSDKKGNKVREVDYKGNEIWPNGPKNKNKKS